MRRVKPLLPVFVLAASLALIPAAMAATTVHFIGAGSSALYNPTAVATVNDLGFAAGTVHHFTVKGTCSGANCAQLIDTRPATIPTEQSTLWVVYVCPAAGCNGSNATDAWVYHQVDSTVGDRAFFARANPGPGAGVNGSVNTCTQSVVACEGQNLVNPLLLQDGVATAVASCGGHATCDDLFLPADVWAAISGATGKSVTAAFTDIRAEDGEYATQRANAPGTGVIATNATNPDGLGYSTNPLASVGFPIRSAFSTTDATPVAFGLPGTNDPIWAASGTNIPVPTTIITIPIGESPIVYLTNRTNVAGGFGQVDGSGNPLWNNVIDNTVPLGGAAHYPLGNFVGGAGNCNGVNPAFGSPAGVDFPVHVVLREPLSGTMNTAEFSSFRIYGGTGHAAAGTSVNNSPTFVPPTSQEMDTFLPGNQKLSAKPCVGGVGDRTRAIGTGEMVNTAILTAPAPLTSTDVFGYAFFTFGNVSKIAYQKNFGYLQLDGVDPIFQTYCAGGACADPGEVVSTEQGELPACGGAGQPACTLAAIWAGGNSYPNLRNGTYRAWSALRAYCDSADANCQGALGVENVIAHAQCDIHNSNSAPDFLPFNDPASPCGAFNDIGVIRSHYAYRLNAARQPNKYAVSHSFEKFVLEANGKFGTFNNLAMNPGNSSVNWPEQGGDAGGCIVPVTKHTFCTVSAGAVVDATHIKYTVACTGPAPAVGDYVTVVGLQQGGDGGIDPDNGVFQITTINTATKFTVVTTGPAPVAATPGGSGAFATTSTGCSQ
jgi:hypothetical protein